MIRIMKVDAVEIMEKHRIEHRYSQDEMAHLLGTTQPTYNNWVNRQREIKIKYLPAIARRCGVSIRDLLPPEFGEGAG